MKYKKEILILLVITFLFGFAYFKTDKVDKRIDGLVVQGSDDILLGASTLFAQNASVQLNLEVLGTYASTSGNFSFNGEIMPDGSTCSNGQILKKTGANDWDCAADSTGGGGGTQIEVQDGSTDIGSFSSISFEANSFVVTDTTGEALVKLDWTNGPASRSMANTWSQLQTFTLGASSSLNLEVGGYASASKYFVLNNTASASITFNSNGSGGTNESKFSLGESIGRERFSIFGNSNEALVTIASSGNVSIGTTTGFAATLGNDYWGAKHFIGGINIASSTPTLLGLQFQDNSTLQIWGLGIGIDDATTGTRTTANAFEFDLIHSGAGTTTNSVGAQYVVGGDAGTMTNAYGNLSRIRADGAAIVNAYGFYSQTAIVTAGSITNYYGLYIDNQTVASNNWAIKTGTGLVDFGDSVSTSLNFEVGGFASISNSFFADSSITKVINGKNLHIGSGGTIFFSQVANPTTSSDYYTALDSQEIDQIKFGQGSAGGNEAIFDLSGLTGPTYLTIPDSATGTIILSSGSIPFETTGYASASQYFSGGLATCASNKALQYNATTGLFGCSGDFQGLDATLTALAAYNTNGILTQTAADTFVGRTLTGTSNQITVTNGDGVSGNPTLSFPSASLIFPGTASTTTDFEALGFASASKYFTLPLGSSALTNNQFGIDNDGFGQFVYRASASEHVLTDEKTMTLSIASNSFNTFASRSLGYQFRGMTIKRIWCKVSTATSVVFNLSSNGTSDTDQLTCTTSGVFDDGSIANATINKGSELVLERRTVTGESDFLTIVLTFVPIRE